jgi:hypothetical protein
VGTMSGGLEIIMFRTLDKIWAKLKNKFNSWHNLVDDLK